MLWRRSSRPPNIPPSAPVPDAEALRRAALHASWRRDRWVARRRIGLRWLMWMSGRYLMPAMLVFGLGAWIWLGVLPGLGNPLDQLAWFPQPAVNPAPPAQVAVVKPAPSLPAADPAETAYSPEGEELPVPLRLRIEPRWAASANRDHTTVTVSTEVDSPTPTQPHLKPENWLHSKEP